MIISNEVLVHVRANLMSGFSCSSFWDLPKLLRFKFNLIVVRVLAVLRKLDNSSSEVER